MNAVASKINSPEYNEPSAQVNTPALASLGGVCRHDDIIFDNKDAVGSFKKEITKPNSSSGGGDKIQFSIFSGAKIAI